MSLSLYKRGNERHKQKQEFCPSQHVYVQHWNRWSLTLVSWDTAKLALRKGSTGVYVPHQKLPQYSVSEFTVAASSRREMLVQAETHIRLCWISQRASCAERMSRCSAHRHLRSVPPPPALPTPIFILMFVLKEFCCNEVDGNLVELYNCFLLLLRLLLVILLTLPPSKWLKGA